MVVLWGKVGGIRVEYRGISGCYVLGFMLLFFFFLFFFFFLRIRRPPRSTLSSSSAASDVYKRQPFIVDAIIGLSVVYKALENLDGLKPILRYPPDPKICLLYTSPSPRDS